MGGENVMDKVAEILGVELGEVFIVENSSDDTIEHFRLTMDGAQHFSPDIRGFVTLKGIKFLSRLFGGTLCRFSMPSV